MTTKYEVRDTGETIGLSGTRVFTVSHYDPALAAPARAATHVWVDPDNTCRCVSCSGPLTAMLSSCRHARTVKRFLEKENQK